MTDGQDIESAAGGQMAQPDAGSVPSKAGPATRARIQRKRRQRSGLGARLFLLLLALVLVVSGFALSGRAISLPVWLVAEVETRINRALTTALPDGAVAIGGVDLTVDSDWVPRLRLDDVRLLKQGGTSLLTLPEVRLTLDPAALLEGQVRPATLRIIGARLVVIRDKNGHFDLKLGAGQMPQIDSFAQAFDLADLVFAAPLAASLSTIEAEALTLTLQDQRAGRTWELGDGRLSLQNRPDQLAAELGLSLDTGGSAPALAVLTVVSDKGRDTARMTATISGVASQDLASQVASFGWLAVLDAPISGRVSTSFGATGVTAMEARLDIGAGAVQPQPNTRPIAFDTATVGLAFDPVKGRINLTDLSVQSPSIRVKASGHSYLVRADGSRITGTIVGELPDAYLTQIRFSEVMIDPEGLFQEPARFSDGALDLRLRLSPFVLDIGQLSLAEDGRRLTASGQIGADAEGWRAALDLDLNEIESDRLLALWPVTLHTKTRAWLQKNVQKGKVFDVKAALRIEPGQEPRLHIGYSFANADVTFLATLPPVKAGYGYSTIEGKTYTLVLTRGTVTAPQGGLIDVAGSVFRVPDMTRKPAPAEITLRTVSSLTAALSLLDLPPFGFLQKADRPVDLGQGEARLVTQLNLPLQKKVALKDVDYLAYGTVTGFRSDVLVPDRSLTAAELTVSANPDGMSISGQGQIGQVPFDVTFTQGFHPEDQGKARIEGSVALSQTTATEFGLGLPDGMVKGEGQGQVVIDLTKDQPGKLSLVSDLNRIGLSIPEVAWSKPAASTGALRAEVTLGATPRVDRLELQAAGLAAKGTVKMRAGGGLDLARFDEVAVKDWFKGGVEIKGRGPGKDVALTVTGGTADLRRMPDASARKSSGRGGVPITLQLDRLRVSDEISFDNFAGSFSQKGGMNGSFTAMVNGQAAVSGTVVPSAKGSAVRLQSKDAGATLAAAGLFSSARGGTLDLQLTPRDSNGSYDGVAKLSNIRVRNASVLAELLNAVSVVGLLEQLNGAGIVFNTAEANFLLTPKAVQVHRGSAIGASLGVSMAGVYQSGNGALSMQGVVSPVYMLNGIGAMFTRRGEGVFGFNYTLRGTADDPLVEVNPLSILTPGMFREIFRAAPPVLAPETEGSGG